MFLSLVTAPWLSFTLAPPQWGGAPTRTSASSVTPSSPSVIAHGDPCARWCASARFVTVNQLNGRPTARERFRAERQRRQSFVFTVTTVVLLSVAAVALLVATNIVPVPFGNGFSKAEHWAKEGSTPCPTADAMPVAPANVKVQVLNGTDRAGIASQATALLKDAGFATVDPGNSDTPYASVAQISAGVNGVDAAWTVARYFPGSQVVLSSAPDATVTVVLGAFFDVDKAQEAAGKVSLDTPLDGGTSCLQMSEEMLESVPPQSGAVQSGGQSGAPQSGGAQSAAQ